MRLIEQIEKRETRPGHVSRFSFCTAKLRISKSLEIGPQRLVIDLVVELDLGALDPRAKQARASVGRSLLQISVLRDDLLAEERRGIFAAAEVVERGIDVIRQEALLRANAGSQRAFQSGLQQGVEHQIWVGIRADRAHLDTGRILIANRDTHHRATIDWRGLDLVRRFEVRVEPAVRVDAGIQHQTDIIRAGQNAIDELPTRVRETLGPSAIEDVLAILRDRQVGVHTAAIHSGNRLGQEAGGHPELVGYLAVYQLV